MVTTRLATRKIRVRTTQKGELAPVSAARIKMDLPMSAGPTAVHANLPSFVTIVSAGGTS
jgi:hypothetical protein